MEDLIDCQSVHFENIKNGFKLYEGRLNKHKFSVLNIGDIIMIKNSNNLAEYIYVEITSLDIYETFEEMIENKKLEYVLPDQFKLGIDIKNAVKNVYRQWYNEENENEYGVLCIGIKTI